MHNRQTGAAHVPIMFFLILLVMFLGALGFAYVQQTKNGEVLTAKDKALAENKVLKDKDLLVSHYVADVGKAIGKPGKYIGRAGTKLYGDAVLSYPGLMDPKEVEKVLYFESCRILTVEISVPIFVLFINTLFLVERVGNPIPASLATDLL